MEEYMNRNDFELLKNLLILEGRRLATLEYLDLEDYPNCNVIKAMLGDSNSSED